MMMRDANRTRCQRSKCCTNEGIGRKELEMKHLIALSAVALALGVASPLAFAQSSPPALPALTEQQSQEVNARMDAYRRATDARVARNEITADEAARLTQWREWQIAQQVARPAPMPATTDRAPLDYGVPPDYRETVPPDYRATVPPDYVVEPAPAYVPYYRPAVPYYPYYYGPSPYAYWGPSVCAGGFGRHFGGRICF
jgi:hypothetical protein